MVNSYDISGLFYEACDCEVICSCWAELDPVMGQCTGVFVWAITADAIQAGGIDLTGCRLATISHGDSCDNADEMLVVIDARDAGGQLDGTKLSRVREAFEADGPWRRVFHAAGNKALQFVSGEIAIPSAAGPKPDAVRITIKVDGVTTNAVNVQARFDRSLQLVSGDAADSLVNRVSGSALGSVEVGYVAVPSNLADPNDSGLDILADLYVNGGAEPAYRFDLDVTSVTAMRGDFHYAWTAPTPPGP